jgi:hypothetical protein
MDIVVIWIQDGDLDQVLTLYELSGAHVLDTNTIKLGHEIHSYALANYY